MTVAEKHCAGRLLTAALCVGPCLLCVPCGCFCRQCASRLQSVSADLSSTRAGLNSLSAEHAAVKSELSARVAALTEDSTAYKLAIERLLAAKASRDKQIAASIAERNKMAQLLARNRVLEKELERDDSRRQSTDRLSSCSARRVSGNISGSGRRMEEQQPVMAGKREASGEFETADDGKQLKSRQSIAATTSARRAALSPVSPNSLTSASSTQQAAISPRSHKADKAQSDQPLMERVNATLSNLSMDSTTGTAALDDAAMSPSGASWLNREEAMHERKASERMKRTIQLLEDKCRELEKVATTQQPAQQRVAASDPTPPRSTSLRFT